MVMRKITGPKRDKLTGKWRRRLHNEKFHDQVWMTGLMILEYLWENLKSETLLKTRAWRAG
jgi:hypothetical protein